MATELDPTNLTIIREAPYRHPAGTDEDWNCPVCRTDQALSEASLVRVRDDASRSRAEFALVVCSGCRRRLLTGRHRSLQRGEHDVARRVTGRRHPRRLPL